MPNKCSVVDCNSGYKDGPNYPRYKFPQDEQLAAKWLRFLNRPADYVITENSFICSQPFDNKFLKTTSQNFTRLNYNLNPIPTIHPLSIPQSQAIIPTNSRPPPKDRVFQPDQISIYEEKFRIRKFQDVIDFLEKFPEYASFKLQFEDSFVTAYNLVISCGFPGVKECNTIYTDFHVKLSYEGSLIPLPSFIQNSTDHKITHLDALQNYQIIVGILTPSMMLML